MKQYEKYKDIDAPWLMSIPKGWETRKIRYTFDERSEKGYPNEPLLSATQSKGVIPQSMYENRTVSASKDFHLLKLVNVGDFVISLRSFQGGIEYAYYRGIISPAYTVMTPNSILIGGYFRHIAKSADFIKLLQTCVTGIREGQNIDYKMLRKNRLPIPSISEQAQIVKYLDWQIEMIDRLVSQKRKEIGLLKELRQAEINKAVTRGIDPNVTLKDSGVDWIEQVPKHWEVTRLKNKFVLQNNKSNIKSGNYIGLENIESWTGRLIDSDIEVEGTSNEYRNNNVLFCKLRPYLAKVYLAETNGICSTELLVFDVLNNSPKYVRYLLSSLSFIDCVNASTYGAKMPRANANFIANMIIPIPPTNEQQQIVDYITSVEININKSILAIEKEIKLVLEYKTRLISDVTTGKVDIRDIKIPNPKN